MAVRLIPTMGSDLPYNIDGYPLARISEMIISTGHVPDYQLQSGLIAYNAKLPVFSLLLTSFSLTLGIEPLGLLPYFCAIIGAVSVVIIYAFVNRITESQIAAVSAAVFLTFAGFFVYVTAAAMKQLVAIMFLCLLYYVYSRRGEPRFRFISIILLLILPLTHHLTSLVAFISVTMISLVNVLQDDNYDRRWMKNSATEMVFGPGVGLLVLYYYRSVGMEFFSDVSNMNDTVLMLSVCLIALIGAMILTRPVTTRPWFIFKLKEGKLPLAAIFDEKILALFIALGALYANSRIHLFVGAPMTSQLLLDMILPYAFLGIAAVAGLNLIRYTRFRDKPVILAMTLTPLTLMLFSALRGLDIFNFTLAYRAFNFIDIALAVLIGVCIAYLIKIAAEASRKHNTLKIIPPFLFAGFCAVCISTVPLAYNNFELFGIQEVTEDYEFEALEWVGSVGITNVSTDQRYDDIIEPYFGVKANWMNIWRISEGRLHANETVIINSGWTEYGAQISFMERLTFTENVTVSLLSQGNVIYAGGTGSETIYVVIWNEE